MSIYVPDALPMFKTDPQERLVYWRKYHATPGLRPDPDTHPEAYAEYVSLIQALLDEKDGDRIHAKRMLSTCWNIGVHAAKVYLDEACPPQPRIKTTPAARLEPTEPGETLDRDLRLWRARYKGQLIDGVTVPHTPDDPEYMELLTRTKNLLPDFYDVQNLSLTWGIPKKDAAQRLAQLDPTPTTD
jgi:hypothetical protein